MVSMISSRILGSSSITSGDSSDRQQAVKPSNTIQNNDSGSGGYSADRSATSASSPAPLPPILIDLHHHKQKRKSQSDCVEETNKRRKLEELNYTATTVRADLARAGRVYPKMMTARSRIAPAIDISSVQLVRSSTATESPFLFSATTSHTNDWSSGPRYDMLTDFGSAYRDVLCQSRSAYQPSGVVTSRSKSPTSSDSTTSASSLSDTESDDESHGSSTIIVVNARLDDSLKLQEGGAAQLVEKQQQQVTHFITCPPSMSMSMEEAVGVCDSSRLVTSSCSPYKAVFVNAAHATLTGVASDETLGRHLHDFVLAHDNKQPGNNNSKLSLEACAASSSEGKDITVFVVCRKAADSTPSHTKCRMKVTPIVLRTAKKPTFDADVCEVDNVTHFAVDFAVMADQGDEPKVSVVG